MKVLQILDTSDGSGLGYQSWLVVDSFGVGDVILLPGNPEAMKVARCHPIIRAEPKHRDAFGVALGTPICGVRWTEPYTGQDVANPPEAPTGPDDARPSTLHGIVESVKPFQGSYCHVKLHNFPQYVLTLGFGEGLEWPERGDAIEVKGFTKSGQFSTTSWSFR